MAVNGSCTERKMGGALFRDHHVHTENIHLELGLFGLAVKDFLHVEKQRMTGPVVIEGSGESEEIIFATQPTLHESPDHPACYAMRVTTLVKKTR